MPWLWGNKTSNKEEKEKKVCDNKTKNEGYVRRFSNFFSSSDDSPKKQKYDSKGKKSKSMSYSYSQTVEIPIDYRSYDPTDVKRVNDRVEYLEQLAIDKPVKGLTDEMCMPNGVRGDSYDRATKDDENTIADFSEKPNERSVERSAPNDENVQTSVDSGMDSDPTEIGGCEAKAVNNPKTNAAFENEDAEMFDGATSSEISDDLAPNRSTHSNANFPFPVDANRKKNSDSQQFEQIEVIGYEEAGCSETDSNSTPRKPQEVMLKYSDTPESSANKNIQRNDVSVTEYGHMDGVMTTTTRVYVDEEKREAGIHCKYVEAGDYKSSSKRETKRKLQKPTKSVL